MVVTKKNLIGATVKDFAHTNITRTESIIIEKDGVLFRVYAKGRNLEFEEVKAL